MDSLVLNSEDLLELAAGDCLTIEMLINRTSITGGGSIRTNCSLLINEGAISETVQIFCDDSHFLIDSFIGMEPIYENDEELLILGTNANQVPAARRNIHF